MTYRHFKHEGLLYTLAFFLALGLRLAQLGAMPLTDVEAAPALQALHIAQSLKPALSPQPLYILSTSILFFLYGGGTNFLARLVPALAGSVLVFSPILFDRIKPRPSLILAFFIALDPGLSAISRQAASPILAITFLIFTWGFFSKNKTTLAGIFAALACLSGPSIWAGLLGLGITWAVLQSIKARRSSEVDSQVEEFETSSINLRESVREALLPFLITFITTGTLFFAVPNGISAALASIAAFIQTWFFPSNIPAGRLFLSLPVYQPLGLLLGLFAVIRGWRKGSRRIIPLSIWFLVSLLLAIFAPSRQVTDLAWTLIPLGALAALELVRNIDIHPEERNEVAGVIILTTLLWIFAWFNFSGLIWHPQNSTEYSIGFWILTGVLFLIVLSLLLVAAGWSKHIARVGGTWGMVLGLGVLGLAGTIGSAGLRGLNHPEMWWLPSIPDQPGLLLSTINDLSDWGLGNKNSAAVVITGVNSPALEWVLREHQVILAKTLDVSSAPDFVITPVETDPKLVSAYRGQDFSWRQSSLWENAQPMDWVRWISLREMPQSGETIIVWAREGLFLDSTVKP